MLGATLGAQLSGLTQRSSCGLFLSQLRVAARLHVFADYTACYLAQHLTRSPFQAG
ncbi:MAG: hypothetical protein JWO67_5239 [Streptosporangiaceae bacterium]|nr:hypothetical protein [Streptosporangiaceae bacterium]